MDRPDRDGVLAQRVADLLADGAPRTMAAIVAALGLASPVDEYEQEHLEFVLGLDEDRYAYRGEADDYLDVRALLAGRVFTHDPGPLEGDPVRVSVDPDLGLLLLPVLRAERISVGGGGEARWDDDIPFEGLWMPAGPLLEAVGGGTPGFTWQDQSLTVGGVTIDPAESQRLSAGIRRVFERRGTECAELVDLLIDVLLEDDAVFRTPVAPVGRLLAGAELSRRGDYVGPVGVAWKTPLERAAADRDALNTSAYGFDECCHRAFRTLSRGFLEYRAGGAPDLGDLAEAADHGVGAEAFLAAEITGPLADGLAESLTHFADALPRGGAGAQFLRFAAHDLLGEAAEAERCLRRALEADPDFAPALAELATIAEERGRATEAVELLRRLGVPADDPQLRRVQEAVRWGRSPAGRNAPCPCGSGRKYKVCCLGRELPPLAERVDWLFAKAVAFANRPAERELLIELAGTLTRGPEPGELLDALSEPLVTEVALFEHGLLERYLAVRGVLLPEDERALAASWLQRPRSLMEITGITPNGELELRDTRDGQRWVVPAGRAGSAARPGELLLARVCAVGDANRFVGAILTIPLRLRESLLDLIAAEPDAWDWLDWLADATAPPTLANTEGQPLVFCEADYRVDDPQAAARALREGLDEAQDDGPGRVFHQMLAQDGARWVRGTVRLDGDQLRIEANSEARFEHLQERIAALVPGAQPLGIHRTGLEEAMARASASPDATAPRPQPPPGTEQLIAEYLADHDRRWLDMQIPALGGRTPRQAADDPTRREDLLLLLGELERASGSPERAAGIRGALGLPGP
jgi:tetratricopeptide (TPR) repeat protein